MIYFAMPPHRSVHFWKNSVALLIAATLIGFILCELTLQALHHVNPSFIIKKRGGGNHPANLISPAPPLDYGLTPNFEGRDVNPHGDFDVPVKINRHGFRDMDRIYLAENAYIMAVGDSIIYGEGVRLEESFLSLLENRFQKEVSPSIHVIKAGVPGYSEHQALDLLEARYELFKPRMVILGVTASEGWRNIKGYQNEQGFIVDSRLEKKYFRFGDQLFASNLKNPTLAYLDAWQEAHFLLPTFLRQRRKFLKERFFGGGDKKENSRIPDDAAMPPESIKATDAQLARFAELGRKLNFVPVVLAKDHSPERNKKIVETAKDKGLFALDLAPLFSVGGGNIAFTFPHDGHWNASTHRMVAELLYNFLTNQGIMEDAGVESAPRQL